MPSCTAWNATLAGSPPSGPRTTSTPTRSPQVASWSTAAARKVSAAPSTTERSSATRIRASLPTVVVLPVPFTPTTRTTPGLAVGAGDLEPPVHGRVDELEQLVAEHGARVAGLLAVDPEAGAEVADELLGRRDADVGGEQGVLDRLPGVLVEPVARQEAEQAAAEAALRAGEPLAQPHQPRRRALRPLDAW